MKQIEARKKGIISPRPPKGKIQVVLDEDVTEVSSHIIIEEQDEFDSDDSSFESVAKSSKAMKSDQALFTQKSYISDVSNELLIETTKYAPKIEKVTAFAGIMTMQKKAIEKIETQNIVESTYNEFEKMFALRTAYLPEKQRYFRQNTLETKNEQVQDKLKKTKSEELRSKLKKTSSC